MKKKAKKSKSSVVKKAKTFLAGKKATQKWATQKSKPAPKKIKSPELAESLYMNPGSDPAHSPGHRKMNLKDKFEEKKGAKTHPQNNSALNNMTRSARVQRTSAANRRIITGAALGKTGQMTTK